VVEGEMTLTIAGQQHRMQEGGYAFIPPGASWQLFNESDAPLRFHWVRKAYEHVDGIDVPEAFVTNETDITPTEMPGTEGRWTT
jgi:(S)-ureidoglycine aminohydrolase